MPRDAKTVRMAILSRDKEEKAIKEAFSASDADLVLARTIHHLLEVLFTQPSSGVVCAPASLGYLQP